MKVSIQWLKELIDLNIPLEELISILPLRSISTKEVTDDFIELDMKGYNRADFLSLRGVAIEVAAITGSKLIFKDPQEADLAWIKATLPNTKVRVENPDLCPFYTITKIEGLRSGKSSPEVVKKLADSGLRSVDNITDVTNLVMLEYGQPMHAFDTRAVKDGEIIVRCAKKGERITTLDGKTRDLKETDLLIADSENALGIAGVMGGKDSEVNETTNAVLLEAAIFDPISIRKTATSLGLQSEASKRFQHGLTKKRLLQALDAAIKMYESLGGKVTALTMAGNLEDKVRKIALSKKKLEDLVGVKFEDSGVEMYLQGLGFTLASPSQTPRAWEVTPPYWRLDVNIEEDVIEEVARMYGYEKIPATEVSQSEPLQKEDPIFKRIFDLRQKLVKSGLTEVQTYSFYSTDVLNALDADKEKLIKVANPISSETEYLRDNLWLNLVEVLGRNIRKGYKDIGIFEIGKAFNLNPDGNPTENYRLAVALMNDSDNPLAELVSITKELDLYFKQSTPPEGISKLFHPKRFLSADTGMSAEAHLRILNRLGIEKRVAVLEIELESHSNTD